jgi:hypothetical protein
MSTTPQDVPTFGTAGAPPADDVDPLASLADDAGPFRPDDEPAPVETTPLEELKSEAAASVPSELFPIPGRDGWAARYRIAVSDRELEKFAEAGKVKGKPSNTKTCAVALGVLNLGLERNGEPVILDGKPATFRSRPFLDSLGVSTVAEAVLKVHGGLEGNLDRAYRGVLSAGGWGEEAVRPL